MRTSPYLELVPRKACGDLCRALCRPTLSKMARNRTVRQSVRQRFATKWAEQMVLGQALGRARCPHRAAASRIDGALRQTRPTDRPFATAAGAEQSKPAISRWAPAGRGGQLAGGA